MRLLLDTNLILWWEGNHPKLPATGRDLVMNEAEAVYVSQASLWEMAIKTSLGRLRVDLNELTHKIGAEGFEWLAIRNEHLLAVATLPMHEDHKDPFDRLLVAQSLCEPLILLTVDEKLDRYGATVRVV
jgi:PIN domain nuclease of toxin-antitoxin system